MSKTKRESSSFIRGRKGWSILVAAIMLLTIILSGCSKSTTSSPSASPQVDSTASAAPEATPEAKATDAPTAAPKEIVELKAFFPGDASPGFDEVMAAVNDKLKKDNVGAKLNIQFIGWNDYGNLTTVKLASAEEFDMYLDAPWLHMSQMIASNSIIPLDDLVANEPELLKSIPQETWDANKFNGKIMGVPLGLTQGPVNGFLVRQDLREKYGLPPIKTLDDLIKFLYTVKEKDPGLTPFVANGNYGGNQIERFSKAFYTNDFDGSTGTYANAISQNLYVSADKKIHPLWESSAFIDGINQTTKLYKDGIFGKNMAQEQNAPALFNQGKAAATQYVADGVEGLKYLDALKLPGAKLEVVMPVADDWKPISKFQQWNFLVVPKTTKHADRVMDVMNWLSIKENHDLLEYGIQGTDWSPVGDTAYHQISKYSFPGFVMTWRPNLVRTPDSMFPDDKKWFEFAQNANNFRPSLIVGFNPIPEAVKTEVAKIDPLAAGIIIPMGNGVLDAAKGIKSLQDQQTKAGGDKVIAEYQKQLDDYFATKK